MKRPSVRYRPRARAFALSVSLSVVGGASAVGVAGPALAQAPDASADALVADGKVAFRAGDTARAYALFRAAADKAPNHPTALYNAALSARKAGMFAEAGEAYRALMAKDSGDLDVVYGLAEVERAQGHGDEARALYERYLRDEHRPERADLVNKAKAALAALPVPAPAPSPSPAPAPAPIPPAAPAAPATSAAAQAEAERLFAEGLTLAGQGEHARAAARFAAAAAKDPARVDALLKAGLSHRRAQAYADAIAAYSAAIAHEQATPGQRLDGTYGRAESARLKGDVADAIAGFEAYVAGEDRPREARFVERAKALLVELRAASAPTPAVAPPPATTPPPTPTPAPPPAVAVAPAAPPAQPHPLVTPPLLAPPSLAFFGDAVAVDALIADAAAKDAAGDADGAARARAKARALAPADPRLKQPQTPCNADRLLAEAEAALEAKKPAEATEGFQRALACDPTRSAPLWGLSRAADARGDRVAGKHHAWRFVQAKGPDATPEEQKAAFWRSEQP